MIQKLTVPPANACGCCDACPFLSEDGMTYCKVDLEAKQAIGSVADARPGPECVPGEYALLPQGELAALRAENERLRAALRSITECNGAFSRDQLTHAENTIEAMQKTAIDALGEEDTNG